MSIAVDQTRLRRIAQDILGGAALEREGALTILEIVQLAAGVEIERDPEEQAILQAIAQHVGSLAGLKPGELQPIPPLTDENARATLLGSLATQLDSARERELTYALVFVVSVADLELTPVERAALEEFQHALALDHRRAADLVISVSNIVAA